MDDAATLFRIRVVMVSTRAAVRSLIPGDAEQLSEVLGRAGALLDDIEADVGAARTNDVVESLAEARRELDVTHAERSTGGDTTIEAPARGERQ